MTGIDLRVDVVIPTRNRRDLVLGAITNALEQKGVATRVYVVIDGTQDDSAEAVTQLENPRVHTIVHDTPRGVAATRNEGMNAGSAPWIALLDDDDRWAPDKLCRQLDHLAAETEAQGLKPQWSATGCVKTDKNLTPRSSWSMRDDLDDLDEQLLISCCIPAGGSSVLLNRRLRDKVGGFDENLHAAEDWDLWIRLARHSPLSYVDEPLVAYRRWDLNASNNLGLMGSHQREIQRRHGTAHKHEVTKQEVVFWKQHLAGNAVKNGRRLKAARLYTSVALRGRAPGQLAYAAASLVSPASAKRRLDHVETRNANPEWIQQAAAWLAQVPG